MVDENVRQEVGGADVLGRVRVLDVVVFGTAPVSVPRGLEIAPASIAKLASAVVRVDPGVGPRCASNGAFEGVGTVLR